MGNMAFDPNLTARPFSQQPQGPVGAGGEAREGNYGVVTQTGAGVPPRRHKLHRSNIEQEENEMMQERRQRGEFYKYPQVLHKVGGLSREVKNDQECADALAKGWKEDIRDVEELEPSEAPTRINHMTIAQALAFVETHKADAAKLVELRADEQTNGNRKKVLDALADAEDSFGFAGMGARDVAKAKADKAKAEKGK